MPHGVRQAIGPIHDLRPQLGPNRFVRHRINGPTQQILEMELHTEVTHRSGRAIEGNENVDIAFRRSRSAHR
jgi:hypothetical protein